jgi:acyl-CoA reductase-like NAD-dependent aldehyde dehydrogenase
MGIFRAIWKAGICNNNNVCSMARRVVVKSDIRSPFFKDIYEIWLGKY